MLGYWRDYVPDFTARTEKLRRLLAKDAAPWTAAPTEEFKAVVAALVASAPMINFDPTLPVVMEPHSGPKGVATVYLQQDPAGGRWLPVAAYSRALTVAEKRVSGAELELTAIQEGLHKMASISTGAADLQIRVGPDVMEVARRKLHLGPGLLWRLMDILAYNPTLIPWSGGATEIDWDPENDWTLEETDDPVDPELLARLNRAVRVPKWGQFGRGPFVHVAFDGGSREGVGSAGFVIADA